MNKTLLLFKWLFLPYLLVVLLAASLGKEQSKILLGKNLIEEYLIIMFFLIIIDIKIIIIKWMKK